MDAAGFAMRDDYADMPVGSIPIDGAPWQSMVARMLRSLLLGHHLLAKLVGWEVK